MFCYHTRLPVVSLAIVGDESPDWYPDHFGYARWGCTLGLRFPIVKLRDLDSAQLEAISNPFAILTLWHRDAQATRGHPAERLGRKLQRYRQLLRYGLAPTDIRRLICLMEHLFRLDPVRARAAQVGMHQIEVEETGMDTFVTSFEEIGRAEGKIEGRLEGRLEGQIEGQRRMVLRLLQRKLGTLEPEWQDQVHALAPDAVLALGEALLDFTSPADLTAWLEQQGA